MQKKKNTMLRLIVIINRTKVAELIFTLNSDDLKTRRKKEKLTANKKM